MITKNILWTNKYQPKEIKDLILPDRIKDELLSFVNDKEVLNILMSGPPGVGKTTAALALMEELDSDYLMINGSLDRNIDTLRNDIMDFASTVSMRKGRKYVIIDEADNLNSHFQKGFRNFIDNNSVTTGYILTANYPGNIIDPLISRVAEINFNFTKSEIADLSGKFMKSLMNILNSENITYDKNILAKLIMKHSPDWRKILVQLQKYAKWNDKIDSGIFSNSNISDFEGLIEAIKTKNFKNARKWIGENSLLSPAEFYRSFYDQVTDLVSVEIVPIIIQYIAKYQFQAAFVADHEINNMSFVIELMEFANDFK